MGDHQIPVAGSESVDRIHLQVVARLTVFRRLEVARVGVMAQRAKRTAEGAAALTRHQDA